MGVDHFGLLADEWAAEWPDRVALIVDDATWTYAELADAARCVAAALHSSGVRRGDRVPLVDVGGLLAFASVFGAARLGAVAAPMNPRLTPDEIRQLKETLDREAHS